jgi:hypothetical protein
MRDRTEAHGSMPIVAGKRCDGFICEEFVAGGVVQSPANVTYLNLEGTWFRLAIDHPAIFWRSQAEPPRPWAVPEKSWE